MAVMDRCRTKKSNTALATNAAGSRTKSTTSWLKVPLHLATQLFTKVSPKLALFLCIVLVHCCVMQCGITGTRTKHKQ